MKFLILFSALLAIVLAAPAPDAEIVRQESDVQPESYSYVAETSDGTYKGEEGKLKDIGTEHEVIEVHGTFSWFDEKTGEKFTVTYVANENGFQPVGVHLPQQGSLPRVKH